MGKRSDFARVPRDFYPTPAQAVAPLLPHLAPRTRFAEPCAGDGALVDHLTAAGHVCAYAADIDPRRPDIHSGDALTWERPHDLFVITNPPWSRDILHPLIARWSARGPTWLLFDADWMHTVQAVPFLPALRRVVSVGRVKWIAGSLHTGKDNCAWYLFDDCPRLSGGWPPFFGRVAA